MTSYTLYVDESGETGFSKIRTATSGGASPYLTLGAVLVPDMTKDFIATKLLDIASELGKNELHCNKMKHNQKVYYAREISKQRVLLFGVISLKATLLEYKEEIDDIGLFNKCAQYLLERVGAFMKEHNISPDDLKVVFEEGHFDYGRLRSLIKECQKKPIRENTVLLRHISVSKITSASKEDESLLKIADLIAHSLFKAVDKTKGNFHIPETRYLNEIHKRFYHDAVTGQVVGHGLMAIHNLKQLQLDDDVHLLIEGLNGH